MVTSLASAAGEERRFAPRVKTFGGFALSDHLARNYVPSLLAEGAWDAVVLQEQGQEPGYSAAARETGFFAAVRTLDAMIRSAGSKTVLYATFARREGDFKNLPADTYEAMQSRVNEGYRQIATALKTELVPVGSAWQRALRGRFGSSLWKADGMHPSVAGSYLAACAFYAHFYHRSPVGNPYIAAMKPADALALQQYAAEEVLMPSVAGQAGADLTSASAGNGPDQARSPKASAGVGPAAAETASPSDEWGDVVLEAEALLPPQASAAEASAQRECCGVAWSAHAQLLLHARRSGDDVWLDVEVSETGSYELSAVMTRAADYGIVELRLDSAPLGVFDGYAPGAVRTEVVGLGTVRLASGSHSLVLTVTGRHPSSSGYFAGLDLLHLRRVPR